MCGVSYNHHEGHEVKILQALHVLHGKNNQNHSECEKVITASYNLLYKRYIKKMRGRQARKHIDTFYNHEYIIYMVDY